MKKRFLTYLKLALVSGGIIVASTTVLPVAATGVDVFSAGCGAAGGTGTTGTTGTTTTTTTTSGTGSSNAICGATSQDDFTTLMKNIVNVMLVVLGMIAIIMIIIGGIRYTTSNGESAQIQAAKNTVLYAVIGLVVAILAFAIVNFVLASFKSS